MLLVYGEPYTENKVTWVNTLNGKFRLNCLIKNKSGALMKVPVPKGATWGVADKSMYIYNKASNKSKKLGVIRKGTAEAIFAQDGNYDKIITNNGYGYVLKANFSTVLAEPSAD